MEKQSINSGKPTQGNSFGTRPFGDGTRECPYLIGSAAHLGWFRDRVNGGDNAICGVLVSDITYDRCENFTPIAPNSIGYRGIFDGRGNIISGLFINRDDSPWCGLFGNVASGGVVKDVTIRNSYISTGYQGAAVIRLGGIAGQCSGTVSGCDVHATIDARSDLSGIKLSYIYCGGIVGVTIDFATVKGCVFSGDVDVSGVAASNIYCGGIVGASSLPVAVTGCTCFGSVGVSGEAAFKIYCADIMGLPSNAGTATGHAGNVCVRGIAETFTCCEGALSGAGA